MDIVIDTEYIKLVQLLKLLEIVGQGSDGKSLILDGKVKVNGSVAFEIRKKIRPGDVVEVEGYKKITVLWENWQVTRWNYVYKRAFSFKLP